MSQTVIVIRVLYRLRTLSEQAPFDAATFSYSFPLLAEILTQGGIGSEDEEEILEQIAIVLDIIKFHCGECMLMLPFTTHIPAELIT